MRCVQKRYNLNDAFLFAVTRPLMDAFHHELISFLVHVAVELLPSPNLCRSAEHTLQMESALNISAFLYHSLYDTWLPRDSTWEAVRVMMMTQQCQPSGTSAPRRALQISAAPCLLPVEVIIYWGRGADWRVWGRQMPDVGSAATDLEM